MGHTKSNPKANNSNTTNHGSGATHSKIIDGREVEVLYQKMGDRWFAFSVMDDEVFVGSISQEEILEDIAKKNRSIKDA